MKKIVILVLLFTNTMFSQDITGFYLSRYSPVIDMGTMSVMFDVGGLDFYGNPRMQGKSLDMGAAEFQDPWPRIVNAKVNEDAIIVRGDSIKLMASGGEKYVWSTGDTTRTITVAPNITTKYTVTVDEYGTTDIAEVTITVKEPIIGAPIANIGSDFAECSERSILLSANGGNTATYQWSTGDTTKDIVLPLTNNILVWVVVTEGGVSSKDSLMIYVNKNCN